ncbi:Beta-2 adrenergic receptor [Trichoplax sp. H2]|nr:Beta-2 adrenergic receptor [Trichoplax sp. H2]|eukprot:RDD38745.1 Beta-2 adrenergic receptor [Trichoplax sp. H2]
MDRYANVSKDICHVECPLHKLMGNISDGEEFFRRGQLAIAGIYIFIGILGLILNTVTIVIYAIKFRTKITTFHTLIMNLALSDTLCSIAIILLGAKTILIDMSSRSQPIDTLKAALSANNAICKFSYVIFYMTNSVSTLTITGMAVVRYMSLLARNITEYQTYNAKPRRRIFVLIIIWALAISSAIPVFRIVELTPGVKVRCFFANYHDEGCFYNLGYIISITILLCIIPMVTLLYCYIYLAKFLFRQQTERRESFSEANLNSTAFRTRSIKERRAAILVISVTIIFISTSIPFIVYQWIISVSQCNADEILIFWMYKSSSNWIFYEIAHLLFILPPILNPICYTCFNSNFHNACRSVLKNRRLTRESQSSTKSSLLNILDSLIFYAEKLKRAK